MFNFPKKKEYINIWINDKDGKRKQIRGIFLKELPKTIRVQLPNGKVISRKKDQDVVENKYAN